MRQNYCTVANATSVNMRFKYCIELLTAAKAASVVNMFFKYYNAILEKRHQEAMLGGVFDVAACRP